MRGFGVVFTPPIAYRGIVIAKRNTLTLGSKNKSDCSSQLHACHQLSDDCHHDEELADGLKVYHLQPKFRDKSNRLPLKRQMVKIAREREMQCMVEGS